MAPPDSRRPLTVPVIILIVIVVVIALFLVSLYNGLVTKRNQIDEALAQIEVQLKRRHDLIPNLDQRGQGLHGVRAEGPDRGHRGARQRRRRRCPGSRPAGQAENALTASLRSLFAVVENYPELKANENVLASRRS